jgi:hypothetical protein
MRKRYGSLKDSTEYRYNFCSFSNISRKREKRGENKGTGYSETKTVNKNSPHQLLQHQLIWETQQLLQPSKRTIKRKKNFTKNVRFPNNNTVLVHLKNRPVIEPTRL